MRGYEYVGIQKRIATQRRNKNCNWKTACGSSYILYGEEEDGLQWLSKQRSVQLTYDVCQTESAGEYFMLSLAKNDHRSRCSENASWSI